MKLNAQGLSELRKKVESQLVNVPEGQRVHIDKEVLDDLIFFKGKNKDGRVIKVPVWTGQFLRKIDLSEISFENVLFQIDMDFLEDSIEKEMCINSLNFYEDFIEEVMDAEDISRFIKAGYEDNPLYLVPFVYNRRIDFSYTNANIDFSKIYGTKIIGCNFEGLDFSKANGECIKRIYASNFSNTNIKIDFNSENLYLMATDFSNNDFSYVTVDAELLNEEGIEGRLICCNFSNTGLHITYVEPQIPPIYYETRKNADELQELHENKNISNIECLSDKYYKDSLVKQIKEGKLNGCYINGKIMLSLEERQAMAHEKKEEYEKMKEDLFSEISSSIEQQISGFGRK